MQRELTGSCRSSTSSESRRWTTRETTWGEPKATRGRRTSNTSSRTTQANRQTPTSRLANPRTSRERRSGGSRTRRTGSQSRRRVGGGRTVDGTGDNVSTANDGQTQCPFFFGLDERSVGWTGGGLGFPLHATEFFCVCQNKVHVLEPLAI